MTETTGIERELEMNNYYAIEVIVKERRADLLREAEQARLLKSGQDVGQPEGLREMALRILSRPVWLIASWLGRNSPAQVSQPCP